MQTIVSESYSSQERQHPFSIKRINCISLDTTCLWECGAKGGGDLSRVEWWEHFFKWVTFRGNSDCNVEPLRGIWISGAKIWAKQQEQKQYWQTHCFQGPHLKYHFGLNRDFGLAACLAASSHQVSLMFYGERGCPVSWWLMQWQLQHRCFGGNPVTPICVHFSASL